MASEWVSGVDMSGVLGTTSKFLGWFFLIILVAVLIYVVIYLMSFKNTITVRKIVNGRKQVRTLKWRVQKDKSGIRWLVTPFYKLANGFKRAVPSAKALELGKGGRLHTEAWYDEQGDNLIWIHDSFDMEKFLAEHSSTVKDEFGNEKVILDKDYATKFAPLDTADRELLVSEIINSKQYGKKSGWEIAMQLATYLVPVILVVVFAMTIGDIAEAFNSMTGPMIDAVNNVADSLEKASMYMSHSQDFGATNITGGAPN